MTPMAETQGLCNIVTGIENVLQLIFAYIKENSFKKYLQFLDSFLPQQYTVLGMYVCSVTEKPHKPVVVRTLGLSGGAERPAVLFGALYAPCVPFDALYAPDGPLC